MSTSVTDVGQRPTNGQRQPQWNVQVVRGKVTTRCLWNACKALSIGLLLLAIGTSMAIVGYYADQLSIRSEIRGNSTVKIKNESRGFHLNNLSYAGPIVMGIGGFIVVAACVMTFEARDSATKVVPARFKPNPNSSVRKGSPRSSHKPRSHQKLEAKKNTSCQTGGARNLAKSDRENLKKSGNEWSPKNNSIGSKAFASAFVQFSRGLLENSLTEGNRRIRRIRPPEGNLNKSPSAPNLISQNDVGFSSLDREIAHNLHGRSSSTASPKTGIASSRREAFRHPASISNNLLLRPNYLQRQALSMENAFYETHACFTPPSTRLFQQQSRRSGGSKESFEVELDSAAGVGGSQTSMALDLHDCQVTLKVKDEAANKRSDTARRHQLMRQKPVEDDREDRSPRCLCISKFLFTPKLEDRTVKTDSSLNLKGCCHHCTRIASRSQAPKIASDIRSQSFSLCPEPKRTGFNGEEEGKIFCIEDHHREANPSTENIRICCEEKSRCPKMHYSPSVSPCRSPRGTRIDHRMRIQECRECSLGKVTDSRRTQPLVRKNAKRSKCNRRIEGSHSAEEENMRRGISKEKTMDSTAIRSASFSPTANYSLSRSGGTSPTRSPSPGTVSESRKVGKLESVKNGSDPIKGESEEPT